MSLVLRLVLPPSPSSLLAGCNTASDPACPVASSGCRSPPARWFWCSSPRGARRLGRGAGCARRSVDGRGFTCTYAVASTRATSRSTLAAAVGHRCARRQRSHSDCGLAWSGLAVLPVALMALWLAAADAASVAASARPSGVQLGFRAVLTGVLVAGLSTSSRVLGAGLTGVLGSVPLVVAVVAPSTHRDRGSPAAWSMLRALSRSCPAQPPSRPSWQSPLSRSAVQPPSSQRASLWRWSTVPSASGKTGVADAPLGQTAASAHQPRSAQRMCV